jgi:ribosome maturation factor RimP
MEVFMVSEEEILAAFDLYLTEENLELYDLNIANYPAISRVEVFIVSDYEIDVDLTSRLNKQLQRLLENMGIEKGSYEMIVSSPGIERKLKTNRHFELALGQLVKIKLFEPIKGNYVLEGYIGSVSKQEIKLIIDSEDIVINFSNIKNAKIEFKQFKEKVKG